MRVVSLMISQSLHGCRKIIIIGRPGAEFSYACRMTKHGNNSDTTDTTKIDVVQKLHR